MARRFHFVTIGQSPRTDLVPEIRAWLPDDVEIEESGVLDGLGDAEIRAGAPADGQHPLVSRLADGRQVVLGKPWVRERVQRALAAVDPGRYTASVLLCTGRFDGLAGAGLVLGAQEIVDHGVAALAGRARRLGVLVPLEGQARDHHLQPAAGRELAWAVASPYTGDDFAEAGRCLADCDLIVMHCMGYSEAHRAAVAEAAGRPVLLARRQVAAALAQLL